MQVFGSKAPPQIDVAIAEKLTQIWSAKRFAARIAGADPKAGTKLIGGLDRGGDEGH